MEFKHGEAERGRTIFEGVMSNYPKRVDLWSIYLDMEIRAGEQDIIRYVSLQLCAAIPSAYADNTCLPIQTSVPACYQHEALVKENEVLLQKVAGL